LGLDLAAMAVVATVVSIINVIAFVIMPVVVPAGIAIVVAIIPVIVVVILIAVVMIAIISVVPIMVAIASIIVTVGIARTRAWRRVVTVPATGRWSPVRHGIATGSGTGTGCRSGRRFLVIGLWSLSGSGGVAITRVLAIIPFLIAVPFSGLPSTLISLGMVRGNKLVGVRIQ